MPSSFDIRGKTQPSVPIAQLQPSISPDTITIVGQVALIWPYSSSKKSFGLLIVEPDFRLRRERGQVHVNFSNSSAKAVALSGVKIGDEVLLSMVGVEWTKDEATPRTPGHGIDWELCFRERLVLQISRNSQELTLLDIDHPTPSPKPPTHSPVLSPSTGLNRTRSRINSETDTQSWSSPAFLRRNQLPYATYLNTQYDPFRDESIFEDGKRRKKMRLGRESYKWTFANTTPSPDKEGRLKVHGSSRGTSPDLVEGVDDGIPSTVTLPSEKKGVLTDDIGHDKNLFPRSEDEAMVDELASEKLTEHAPQASSDFDVNGHILLNEDALPGVTSHKPLDRDPESKTSIKRRPGRQELRPEPSEVNIQDEDILQTLAKDHQSTPTRRDSSIRQESPPSDAAHNLPKGASVNEPSWTEDLDRADFRPESSGVNVQNEDSSQILAKDRQSTPTHRDSSISQGSLPSDATRNSPYSDLFNEPLTTEDLDRQEFCSEPSEVNMQNEDSSQILAEDRQSTPTCRDSSISQESRPSDATRNSPYSDLFNEPLITGDLDRQNFRSESSEVNVQNEDSSQILAEGCQFTPNRRDSSTRRESPPNDANHQLLHRDSICGSPNSQHLDRQELPPELSEDNMQNEDASQVRGEDHQSSPIQKYSSVERGSPNHPVRKTSGRDPDDEPSTSSLDLQELRSQTSDADMEYVESAQIVPKGRQSSSISRESSTSRYSLSNWTRDKSPEQIIDDGRHPEKGNHGQEFHTATEKDIIEEDLVPQVVPEDRPDSPAIESSHAHQNSPLEHATIKKSLRLKLSQPKRQISSSESSESQASTDSTSPGFVAESQAWLQDGSEDDSNSVRESIDDSSDALSTVSPMHSPHADLEDPSDDQSSTGTESEDELIYIDPGFNTPSENSPNSQISTSLLGVSGSSKITPEGIPGDNPGFGLAGLPISLVRSTVDTLPLSIHKPENSFAPIDTVTDDMEKPKHEALAANDKANLDPLDNMIAETIPPNDEIAKAKEKNDRQDMRSMTLYEDHANEIFQESDPIDTEDEYLMDQNMDRVSAAISAAGDSAHDETDNETKIAVLPQPTSNASLDESRELETGLSDREEKFNVSRDELHSPAQQDNESQFVQIKRTVDIIDLESEEEDGIALKSPQVKEDPSQALVDTGNTDDGFSEDGHVAKQVYEWSRSEGHSEDQVDKKSEAGQAFHDALTTAIKIEGSEDHVDSQTEELGGRDAPSIDTSGQVEMTMDHEHDSGVQHRDADPSPQSSTSALEEALLGDANFDPILRSQLFTPLSSQQRSLKSEQSVVSGKNQQLEHELPTPRLTQSTSAPPLPPTTPEPHEKPSLVERIKAMKTVSAGKALARTSIDYSKAASNWFTRKKPSQLSHVSDSEDERESSPSSDQVSIVDEEPSGSNASLEPSGTNIFTNETPQTENVVSKSPPMKGLRTSFAYYPPLSTLQSHFGTLTSVLAILHSVDPVARSRSGPKDFHRSLFLSDPSTMYHPPTIAQIFRPKQLALPIVNQGDAILLRNFKVQSFKKKLGLLSTESSAWAVFRKGVEVQVRGPPVEFGPEERGFIKGLWKWWDSVGAASVEKAIAETPKAATKRAISVPRTHEDEVKQRSKGKTNPENSGTPRSAKGMVSGRSRNEVEYDMTPAPDSGRHQLRDGTSYPDSTPEKGARSRSGAVVHELRDGTTYTDTDEDTNADGENKVGGRVKTKRWTSAKPRPGVVESQDRRRVGRGAKKKNEEHELRDGTRYSDSLE